MSGTPPPSSSTSLPSAANSVSKKVPAIATTTITDLNVAQLSLTSPRVGDRSSNGNDTSPSAGPSSPGVMEAQEGIEVEYNYNINDGDEVDRREFKTNGNYDDDTTAPLCVDTSFSMSEGPGSSSLVASSTLSSLGSYYDGVEATPTNMSTLFGKYTSFQLEGVSPGKVDFLVAESRIEEDGIVGALIGSKKEQSQDNVTDITDKEKKCLLYIYANEFFWTWDGPERKQQIIKLFRRKIPGESSSPFGRLLSVALADINEKNQYRWVHSREEGERRALMVQKAIHHILDEDGAVGSGFPKQPFLLLQKSGNCFMIAGCTWYTLMLQRLYPNDNGNQYPIDVGKAARKFVLKTNQDLINRIEHDSPRYSSDFIKDLTGFHDDKEDWHHLMLPSNFPSVTPYQFQSMFEYLKSGKFGLISQFFMGDCFKRMCNRKIPSGCGYYLFDGDSIDCEGQWIKIEDEIAIQNKVSKVLFSGDKAGQATDPEENNLEGENENWDKNDYHAMVLMGGFKKNILNEYTRKEEEKWYFVILNGWPNMPLFVACGDYLVACKCHVYFSLKTLDAGRSDVVHSTVTYAESGFPSSFIELDSLDDW